jgi:hypothetical protein
LFWAVPERFNITQGRDLGIELKGFLYCHAEKLCQGLPELIEGRAAEAASKKFDFGTAQGIRRQRDRIARTRTNLNKPDA